MPQKSFFSYGPYESKYALIRLIRVNTQLYDHAAAPGPLHAAERAAWGAHCAWPMLMDHLQRRKAIAGPRRAARPRGAPGMTYLAPPALRPTARPLRRASGARPGPAWACPAEKHTFGSCPSARALPSALSCSVMVDYVLGTQNTPHTGGYNTSTKCPPKTVLPYGAFRGRALVLPPANGREG